MQSYSKYISLRDILNHSSPIPNLNLASESIDKCAYYSVVSFLVVIMHSSFLGETTPLFKRRGISISEFSYSSTHITNELTH